MINHKFTNSWGRHSHILLNNWCNIENLPTNLGALESILKQMPEELIFAREPQDQINATGMHRIKMSDIQDLALRLNSKDDPLHLQAINLDNYHPAFKEFKDNVYEFLNEQIPGILTQKTKCSVGVFLSTPGAVAPFHADVEHNFLIQLKGSKLFHSFSSKDYEGFSSIERENLAVNNIHLLENYKESFEQRATNTHLSPKKALYHPPFSPHWVETDDSEYSLSYTISFITSDVDDQMLIHKVNYYLRKTGIIPRLPKESALSDHIKVKIGLFIRKIKKTFNL